MNAPSDSLEPRPASCCRVALAGATVLLTTCLGCASSHAQPSLGQPSSAPAEAGYPLGESVVIIAGTLDCGGNDDDRVRPATQADATMLRGLLQEGLVLDARQYSNLPRFVRDVIKRSGSARGLTIYYSGHGENTSDASPVARLCLGKSQEHVPVRDLLTDAGSLSPAKPNWTFAVVNSCFSAHVDISGNGTTDSVLTVAHDSVDAFRSQSESRGTLIGETLVSMFNDEPLEPLDRNCDGLITDQELFDQLLTRLSKDKDVQSALHPPHLNLRRDGATHVPLAVRPARHGGCDPENVRHELSGLLDQLSGDNAGMVRGLIVEQMQLAKSYASREVQSVSALPHSQEDFFVIDAEAEPVPSGVRVAALDAGFRQFPGDVQQARVIGVYSISFEVYSIRAENAGRWIRVTRLRDGRTAFVGEAEARSSWVSLRRLAHRTWVVPTVYDAKDSVVQFRRAVPSEPEDLGELEQGRRVVFHPGRARAVACENEVGQCFVVRSR